jgi:hypothetical protein
LDPFNSRQRLFDAGNALAAAKVDAFQFHFRLGVRNSCHRKHDGGNGDGTQQLHEFLLA